MPTTEKREQQDLANFSFDNDGGMDFFNINADEAKGKGGTIGTILGEIAEDEDDDIAGSTNLDEEVKAPPKKKEAAAPEAPKKKIGSTVDEEEVAGTDDEEENEEVTFFEEEDEETEEGEGAEEATKAKAEKAKKKPEAAAGSDKPEVEESQFFATLTKEMVDKGIFQHVEVEEGKEYTEEEFYELQEAEIAARADATIEEFAGKMDDDGKDFIKFKRNGGKTQDFFTAYNATVDLSTFDGEDEAQQERMNRYYLAKVEKLDAEEIEDRIKFLQESGKQKTYASKYYKALKDGQEAGKKALNEKIEADKVKQAENNKKFATGLQTVLSKAGDSIGAFPITKKEKEALTDFITKPTVKIGNGQYLPELHAKLSAILKGESEEDRQKLLILGKLLKRDFNIDDLKVAAKTETVKKVKNKLLEARNTVRVKNSGAAGGKTLADHFD